MHPGWGRILDLSGAQPAPRCWFVGERVPLALDARAVCVEGLADAYYIQARLVRQLLHQGRDLLDRLAVDALLTHSPVNWPKEGGNKRKRAGQTRGRKWTEPPPRPPSRPRPALLTVFGHDSGHIARPRIHVYYDPWVPSGEVGHLLFHEFPEGPEKGEHGDS